MGDAFKIIRTKKEYWEITHCEWCHEEHDTGNRFCSIICKQTYISNLESSKLIRSNFMSSLNKTEEQKLRVSRRMLNNDNTLGFKWSVESKNNLSKSITESWTKQSRIDNHKIVDSFKYKSGSYFSIKTHRDHHYRSSYELTALVIFDADPNITYFESESVRIRYTDYDEKERWYIVDFLVSYIDETKKLIEIKPQHMMNDLTNINKFEAAKEYCKDNKINEFLVWTETELFG